MANADALRRQALEQIANHDHGLLLDLSQVSYLDSAGIGSLVRLSRLLSERQQRFALVVPERSVLRSSLAVGGIPGLIPTYHTLQEARSRR
jgi:anti-anti-sigma factor